MSFKQVCTVLLFTIFLKGIYTENRANADFRMVAVVDAGCYRSNFNFQVRMRRGRNERTNPEGRRWEGEQSIGAGERGRERDALHAWNGGRLYRTDKW